MVALAVSQSIATLEWLNSGHFSPATLFATSEPGVWYDPSDVANTNWRYNLLTWTEQFDNAVWGKANVSVTANTIAAPDDTVTADLVSVSTTAFAYLNLFNLVSVSATSDYSLSFWVKAGTVTSLEAGLFDNSTWGSGSASIISGPGALTQVTGSRFSVTGLSASQWTRIRITRSAGASGISPYFYPRGQGTSIAGDSFYIWGAQLELGSTATTYQPITTVEAETIARFPQATLYQDSVGTIPVTAPAQPVGLMLDKKNGLVLGPQLVTNGDFSSGDTGWTVPAGWTITGGSAVATATTGSLRGGGVTTVSGVTYRVDFDVVSYTSGTLLVTVGGNFSGNPSLTGAAMAPGRKSVFVISGSSTTRGVEFYGGSITATIDNISVRELPGTHATQSTAASRPTYGIVPATGRRNLFLQTENFSVSPWAATVLGTSTRVNTTSPYSFGLGLITATSANGGIRQMIGVNSFVSGQTGSLTFFVQSASSSLSVVFENGTATYGQVMTAALNPSDGTVGALTGFTSATSVPFGTGYIYTLNMPAAGGTLSANVEFRLPNGASMLLGRPQIQVGSATAYQRVVTDFEVTEANVASLSYLSFDGIDDFMVTPTISPDTATSDGAARRNLLTFPSAFNDAAWTKGNGTISANSSVAPDGTTTADTLVSAASTAATFVQQAFTSVVSAYTATFYVKASGAQFVQLLWASSQSTNFVNFDIVNGTVGTNTATSATISAFDSGWYRISITSTLAAAAGALNLYIVPSSTSSRGASFAGNGTSGILVWGAQLELGSTATAFQNIGTDKVQVFTGVRKLSDAATATLASFGGSSANSWELFAPRATNQQYSMAYRTTTAVEAFNFTGIAPDTAVLTGTGDIGAPRVVLRRNGVVSETNTTALAFANFATYPLFIGRRGGTTLPFNGQMYGLITRFGANLNTSQLVSTEGWMNTKTRAY